jgi:hypothetical protein
MKPGDLVLIKKEILSANESQFGIFLNDSIYFDEWGYLPIIDCTLLWMGELTPFEKNSLELVNELNETG